MIKATQKMKSGNFDFIGWDNEIGTATESELKAIESYLKIMMKDIEHERQERQGSMNALGLVLSGKTIETVGNRFYRYKNERFEYSDNLKTWKESSITEAALKKTEVVNTLN